ncbi:hypothetical protein ACHAWF_010917 [Thalassiosira exigua]
MAALSLVAGREGNENYNHLDGGVGGGRDHSERPPRRRRLPGSPAVGSLNETLIEADIVLRRRYRWVRQSEALSRLLDEGVDSWRNASDRYGENYNNNYYGGVNNNYGRRMWGGGDERRHADGRWRRLDGQYYDDAFYQADDGGNAYDDAAVANDDAAAASDDAAAAADDAAAAADDASAANDDYAEQLAYICDSKTCTVNEQCTKFLFGFLEGTTDAKDNCEGIMNAYVAADCGTIRKKSDTSVSSANADTTIYNMDDDFNDDYFGIFYDHQCCSSLRSHYYEYCDATEVLNGANLLVIAGVMLLCECAKSVVKKNRIRFLPEAAACMLVGMAVALGAGVFGTNIENIGFDEEIFMYLLLPPIIFEATLSVNKREFRRRRGAIMVFAVFGTLFASFITGAATYYTSRFFGDESISILDSLVFGSLISSIDPVAILSVLTSLKMSETDTIYILVFGESLLNDGIAITLFKSLVQQYESKSTISLDDILGSIADFLIIAFGSCVIGLACGVACLCYFHLNSSILHPVMEVASFFLWAVVPYWMAEAFDWSGIVAIVIMGFFMDIYLRPGWDPAELELEEGRRQQYLLAAAGAVPKNLGGLGPSDSKVDLRYYNWEDDDNDNTRFRFRGTAVDIPRPHSAPPPPPPEAVAERVQSDASGGSKKTNKANNLEHKDSDADTEAGTSMTTNPNIKAILMKREFVRMSREADEHVRFVAHILSSLSENAIFAYLGLFLFSSKYEWDSVLCSIGVTACVLSRALMVVCASWFIWYMHVFRQRAGCHNDKVNTCIDEDVESGQSSKAPKENGETVIETSFVEAGGIKDDDSDSSKNHTVDPLNTPISKSARALSNYKVQVVLILAGLRGAVSLALVESVPIYNGVTGVGSKNKPLLKAMTSSAIIFTIFVLGGGAYYILKWLDISSDDMLIKHTNKSNNRNGYGAYIYPPLICTGYTNTDCSTTSPTEMELTSAPSWRSHHSHHSHHSARGRTGSSPNIGHHKRLGSFVPPDLSPKLIGRSRSDWSHTSNYSAGLNDIADRHLSGKHAAPAEPPTKENPRPFAPQIV